MAISAWLAYKPKRPTTHRAGGAWAGPDGRHRAAAELGPYLKSLMDEHGVPRVPAGTHVLRLVPPPLVIGGID